METLSDLIVATATRALSSMDPKTGNMPPGHNGPYKDSETPVRNTGHWLITFAKAYELTGNKKFRVAVEDAANYLTSQEVRPMGANYWHRMNPEKDACNGLIGPAWTIEALLAAGRCLDRPDLIQTAINIFLLHPFNEQIGLWQRVAVDGMRLPVDETFNHQLWFAAAGGLIPQEDVPQITEFLRRFMDRIEKHVHVYRSGLIKHFIPLWNSWDSRLKTLITLGHNATTNRSHMVHKSIGYHAFNLHGFALLHSFDDQHPFWKSRKFKSILKYSLSSNFKESLENNLYGFTYNPTGLEMAFALQTFAPGSEEEVQWWLTKQFRHCFDSKILMMSRNTMDPETLSARIYQATQIRPDTPVDIDLHAE